MFEFLQGGEFAFVEVGEVIYFFIKFVELVDGCTLLYPAWHREKDRFDLLRADILLCSTMPSILQVCPKCSRRKESEKKVAVNGLTLNRNPGNTLIQDGGEVLRPDYANATYVSRKGN